METFEWHPYIKGGAVLFSPQQVLAVWDLAVKTYREVSCGNYRLFGRAVGCGASWVALTGLCDPQDVADGL